VAGYLTLDPTDPVPKLIHPERAPLEVPLSRHLTEQVRNGRSVWLFGDEHAKWNTTQSLSAFTDAVCVPICGPTSEPLAALHVYRTGRVFQERDILFIEATAKYLTQALESVRNRRKLEAENDRLRGALPSAEEIIGDSSAMMAVRQQIGRAAQMPFTVLITGESGSGKELVALALHRNSPRATGPLVVVNCAAMTPTLLEAELFGYRKGAFAGADHDQPGLFEQADEGTLFLDEIADLSMECQAKLLRVIEGKSFRQIGSTRDIAVDVRVIAATHRDLESEVRGNRFRQDLLFRLKVITIKVPPLREHPEDIIELAHFFLERLAVQCRRPFRLSPAAERKLFTYSWPGNVRQLRAVLESAAVMSEGEVIEADILPLTGFSEPVAAPSAPPPSDVPTSLAMDDLETWAIMKALKHTSGNVSQAARVLGISRDTLHTKLKKKNIDRDTLTITVAPNDTVS
jgi:DNA-binding NtrC family response regulator